MHLRNILLAFSVLMIGFCLTLYFQSESPIQSTMSFDQYLLENTGTKSFSLEEFNQKITPLRLEAIIAEVYSKNKLAGERTRVMQVGIRNGRSLMELKRLFPEVEFYGVAKEKTHEFYRRESFMLTALKFNLFTKPELEEMVLPYVIFQDLDFGQRIPYDENKFDVIYSQDAIPNIRYTFELLNEIMRVLKKGGISIHSDFTGVNVFSSGVVIDLKEVMKEFRKKGIDAYVLDNPLSIRFKKPDYNALFPVTPHQPIPANLENLSIEQRRPEMGYNLNP